VLFESFCINEAYAAIYTMNFLQALQKIDSMINMEVGPFPGNSGSVWENAKSLSGCIRLVEQGQFELLGLDTNSWITDYIRRNYSSDDRVEMNSRYMEIASIFKQGIDREFSTCQMESLIGNQESGLFQFTFSRSSDSSIQILSCNISGNIQVYLDVQVQGKSPFGSALENILKLCDGISYIVRGSYQPLGTDVNAWITRYIKHYYEANTEKNSKYTLIAEIFKSKLDAVFSLCTIGKLIGNQSSGLFEFNFSRSDGSQLLIRSNNEYGAINVTMVALERQDNFEDW